MKKISLLITVVLMTIMLIPSFSHASTTTVDSDETLRSAVENAQDGDIIELTTDISLKSPIEFTDKDITINGKGFSISKDDSNWSVSGSNASLLTAGLTAKLTLSNITLKNSQKYGVQAYNGGYVVLDDVKISNCGYGGVLVNAGTVEIKKLSLGHNGLEDSNNGIEIAKGKEIDDNLGSNQPKLIMNGELESTEETNVIYLASNDNLTEFSVENTENSTDKVLIDENKVVVINENNEVKFESNTNEKIQISGDPVEHNVTITINLVGKTTTVTVPEGTILTQDELIQKIDLSSLDLSNYTIVGFFTDEALTTAVDFANAIATDVTMYAKLDLIETSEVPEDEENEPKDEVNEPKDETPKTGIESNIGIVLLAMAISTIALATLKKKVL